MSHFVVTALVEPDVWQQGEAAVRKRIAAIMAPYDENLRTEPRKEYLSAEEIARMARSYNADPAQPAVLVPYLEDWDGSAGGYDAGGLYALRTRNARATWDWYTIGGRWDGDMLDLPPLHDPDGGFNFGGKFSTLARNACAVSELRNDWVPYAVVSAAGWMERGCMGWFGIGHDEREEGDWKGEYVEFLSAHAGYWAISLDVHI